MSLHFSTEREWRLFWKWRCRRELLLLDRLSLLDGGLMYLMALPLLATKPLKLSSWILLCVVFFEKGCLLCLMLHAEKYRLRRSMLVIIVRLFSSYTCAHFMSHAFPIRTENVATYLVSSVFKGPALALAFCGLGFILPFKMHVVVQALAVPLTFPCTVDWCSTATPEHVAFFRHLEQKLDGVGAWLFTQLAPLVSWTVDTDDFLARLEAPAARPCMLISSFLVFWLGFAVPTVIVYALEKGAAWTYAREVLRIRTGAVRQSHTLPSVSVIVALIKLLFLFEITWRIAKRANNWWWN